MLVSEDLIADTFQCRVQEATYIVTAKDTGFKKLSKGKYHLLIHIDWDEEAIDLEELRKI